MKIAYIGIDLFYPALLKLNKLGCQVVEVFTCQVDNKYEFNQKVCDFAQKRNIPCSKSPITRDDINRLIKKGCKMAICGGYYFKIPFDTGFPIVNIHPSLLPVGRGSWPMAQSILWGHKMSGITIHKIQEGFDEGDILMQKQFKIAKDENHKTFMKKANKTLVKMLPDLIKNFDEFYKNAAKQTGGEYWQAPKEEDYTITPQMTVKEADIKLRAFFGYECIYKEDGKKTVIVNGHAVKTKNLRNKKFVLSDGYIRI